MKIDFIRCFLTATFCMVLLSGKVSAVSLIVTPAAISNTNTGPITLSITGLTNSQQVTVETYMDVNGNGTVEAGEPLMDAFKIKDGGASIIGGITNISVPYDSNTATGAITTSLGFALPLENITGRKIYRVIGSPSSAFTPVTAALAITNAVLAQSVSGTVYSNGVAPQPYALIAVLTVTNQNYIGSTIADATGHYFMTLNPGAYLLLPVLPGYYTDQGIAPLVTLTNGMAATNDLFLTNSSVAVSGQVFDSTSSNALDGIFLQVQSGSLFGVAFTDTNGNYAAGINSNNWKITLTSERMSRRGYVVPQDSALQVNATLGNVTNANIALEKGNALFYGQLTLSGMPVPNIPVEANDGYQILSGKGYTDADGNYAVVALVDTNVLGPDDIYWYCSASTGDQSATVLNGYIINQLQNTLLTNDEAVLLNFFPLPITASITGRLVSNNGLPVAGVSMGANANIGGQQYGSLNIDTDTNGDFTLGAANGQWYVSANCCGNEGLDNQGYYDPFDGTHVVNIPPNNSITIIVYPVGVPVLSQSEHISSSQFGFNLGGSAGNNYTIQAITNLASTNWFNLMIISNFGGNVQFIQDNNATNQQRFYRALQGP